MLTTLALTAMTMLTPTTTAPNTLTPAEAAAGWTLLFDGVSTDSWRSFKKETFPSSGWSVEDGALRVHKGGGGKDIISKDQYTDFEFSVDFKCAPGANSGIMYRASEAKDYPWMTGPEFQVLDDSGHKDGMNPKHSVGALYDLIAPPADKPTAAPNQWNNARIRIKDGLLQHFLNGRKVVECRIDDQAWKDLIAGSKFKAWPGFGLESSGHLALQEHGDDVWFRNIKVRDLTSAPSGQVELFNGKDLTGWDAFVPEASSNHRDPRSVWRVEDGILICSGSPPGYLYTTADHTSFILNLEWRFSPETRKAGNSGVLVRVQEPHNVWPRSIEAQLMSGSAGDFWCIGEYPMTGDPARTKGRNTKHTHAAERPVGEWNHYEIIVEGPTVSLFVNGELLNQATGCEVLPGKIALQSEGTEIHFRNIRLTPIP